MISTELNYIKDWYDNMLLYLKSTSDDDSEITINCGRFRIRYISFFSRLTIFSKSSIILIFDEAIKDIKVITSDIPEYINFNLCTDVIVLSNDDSKKIYSSLELLNLSPEDKFKYSLMESQVLNEQLEYNEFIKESGVNMPNIIMRNGYNFSIMCTLLSEIKGFIKWN